MNHFGAGRFTKFASLSLQPCARARCAIFGRDIGQAFEKPVHQRPALRRFIALRETRRIRRKVLTRSGRCKRLQRLGLGRRRANRPFRQFYLGRACRIIGTGRLQIAQCSDIVPFAPDRVGHALPIEQGLRNCIPAGLGYFLVARQEGTADIERFLGAGHRDIHQPPVFLAFARLLRFLRSDHRARLGLFRHARQRYHTAIVRCQLPCPHRAAIRVARRIGEDNDRCLQPFGPMRSEHPHSIAAAGSFPLQFLVRGIEPVEEALQARRMLGGIGEGRADQLVDWVIRLAPQPRDELAASIPRAGQQPLQQRLWRFVIDLGEKRAQPIGGLHAQRRIAAANMVPQRHLLLAQAVFEQIVLRPAA